MGEVRDVVRSGDKSPQQLRGVRTGLKMNEVTHTEKDKQK